MDWNKTSSLWRLLKNKCLLFGSLWQKFLFPRREFGVLSSLYFCWLMCFHLDDRGGIWSNVLLHKRDAVFLSPIRRHQWKHVVRTLHDKLRPAPPWNEHPVNWCVCFLKLEPCRPRRLGPARIVGMSEGKQKQGHIHHEKTLSRENIRFNLELVNSFPAHTFLNAPDRE